MPCHPETIRSSSNAIFKRALAVSKGKEDGWTLLEGARLVSDGLQSNLVIEAILMREDRKEDFDSWDAQAVDCFAFPPALFQRLGSVKNPPPIMAIAKVGEPIPLERFPLSAESMILVVAGIANPGNFGALARSAEAAGADGIVQVGTGVDPWNPAALRGSMGSLLRMPIGRETDSRAAMERINQAGFRSICAATRGGSNWTEADWSGRIALWVTGETGEAPAELAEMDQITIPLAGAAESLNVTVAASLLLFAAGRSEENPNHG